MKQGLTTGSGRSSAASLRIFQLRTHELSVPSATAMSFCDQNQVSPFPDGVRYTPSCTGVGEGKCVMSPICCFA